MQADSSESESNEKYSWAKLSSPILARASDGVLYTPIETPSWYRTKIGVHSPVLKRSTAGPEMLQPGLEILSQKPNASMASSAGMRLAYFDMESRSRKYLNILGFCPLSSRCDLNIDAEEPARSPAHCAGRTLGLHPRTDDEYCARVSSGDSVRWLTFDRLLDVISSNFSSCKIL